MDFKVYLPPNVKGGQNFCVIVSVVETEHFRHTIGESSLREDTNFRSFHGFCYV